MYNDEKERMIKTVIHCVYIVRKNLGEGFLESVYQNALMIELKNHGIKAEKEFPIDVLYIDGSVVGTYKADILVEGCLILELKTTSALTKAHEMQLVNYLKATRIDDGLLVNFYGQELQIKRKYRNFVRYR